jgi:signal transduction histidine kinase
MPVARSRFSRPGFSAKPLGALIQFAEVAIQRLGLGRLRVQFVASVSHELRTPLTSIKAFCEMLYDGDAGPLTDEQLSFVRRIATGADQLHKIVEDLLELSRLRSETETLNVDQINVKLFLEDTASILQPQADARGIQIGVSAPDDLPTLHTDQRRLHQALSNFIDNAIKYSPEGSPIAVAATLRDEKMRLCVTDRGRGIPEQDLKRIFEEFYRCQKGVNGTASEGAGLGLAIVARIADMLGAKIEVDSTWGAGSTFCLSFSLENQ